MDDDTLEPLPPDATWPTAADHELRGLLSGTPGPGADADALRSVLARHDRWRTRSLAGALALALVVGPVAGYLAGQTGRATTIAAAARPSTGVEQTAPEGAAASLGSAGPSLDVFGLGGGGGPDLPATQVLLRDALDGTRIRLYSAAIPTPKAVPAPAAGGTANPSAPSGAPAVAPAPSPGAPAPMPCAPFALYEAEVSNDQVAGTMGAASPSELIGPLSVLGAQVVGRGQPAPIATVVAHAGDGVAKVVLDMPGVAHDEMAPQGGIVALAVGIGSTPAAPLPTPPALTEPAADAPGSGRGAASGAATAPVPKPKPKMGRGIGLGFPASTLTAFDAAGKVLAAVAMPSLDRAAGAKAVTCGRGIGSPGIAGGRGIGFGGPPFGNARGKALAPKPDDSGGTAGGSATTPTTVQG